MLTGSNHTWTCYRQGWQAELPYLIKVSPLPRTPSTQTDTLLLQPLLCWPGLKRAAERGQYLQPSLESLALPRPQCSTCQTTSPHLHTFKSFWHFGQPVSLLTCSCQSPEQHDEICAHRAGLQPPGYWLHPPPPCLCPTICSDSYSSSEGL